MRLNCRPGDTARVISNAETRRFGVDDQFVRVVSLAGRARDGALAWRLEEPLPLKNCLVPHTKTMSDAVLRPIRDPGDDAVDEMLLRVPSPSEPVT